MTRAVVLVHPGSFWVSGAGQLPGEIVEEAEAGITDEIEAAEVLVVIDGDLSGSLGYRPGQFIERNLHRLAQEGRAFRLWGCDAGEPPYAVWKPVGLEDAIHTHQEEAALAVAPRLAALGASEILVTGAWATRDGSSGCVNCVADALRRVLPEIGITVSENALYEEDLETEPEDAIEP